MRQVDAAVCEIEERRRAERLSIELLCGLAGLTQRSYRAYLAGRQTPRAATLTRLRQALELLAGGSGDDVERAFHARIRAVALSLGVDDVAAIAAAARAADGGVPGGHLAMQVRREAAYLTVTGQGVAAAELARVIGVSRQAVSRLVQDVEEAREDPAIDRRLTALEKAFG